MENGRKKQSPVQLSNNFILVLFDINGEGQVVDITYISRLLESSRSTCSFENARYQFHIQADVRRPTAIGVSMHIRSILIWKEIFTHI